MRAILHAIDRFQTFIKFGDKNTPPVGKDEPGAKSLVSSGQSTDAFAYLLIAFGVLLLYVETLGFYLHFTSTVLPKGDPFTYTNGFFKLLDLAHQDYFAALDRAFEANWYWLLNLMIVLFSPILVKEPASLSLVNFIMYGLATASVYRLMRNLKFNAHFALLCAWLVWIFPINYGFLDYSSVPVMGLDAMFMGILHVSVANVLVYAMALEKLKNALIAGIATGLAVWGRGNSLPVVGLVLFCPAVFLLLRLWKTKSMKAWMNFSVFVAIAMWMTDYFYAAMGKPIAQYYTAHAAFVKRHVWNVQDAMPYFKNIPGFFYWRFENSIPTMVISWVSHTIVLASLLFMFYWKIPTEKRPFLRLICFTGAFIYFATYVINILLFTDPHMNIYNCLLIYAPMRIGFFLSICALFGAVVLRKNITIRPWLMLPLVCLFFVYGVIATKVQTPKPVPGIPTPNTVESFARDLDRLLDGGSLSILWYRHYNPAILRYYRIKNGLSDVPLYTNKYYNDIWAQYDYSEEKRKKVREEIKKHFEEATLIIIPEYVDYYGLENPYSFYKFRDEITNYLNSDEIPRFVVRMVLKEYDHQRLLVLQREENARNQGEPLQLPYGPSTLKNQPEYASVPHW